MTCKHTISTAVDEDGCCSSCGKDLNPLFEKHCGGCPIVAENAKLRTALTDLYACQNGPPLIRDTEKWNAAMNRTAELLPEF